MPGPTGIAPSSQPPSRGLLLVVSGPSGVGKTTITHRLREIFDGVFSVSATTRAPGPGEVDGRDYRFVSREEFQRMLDAGEFLEHAQVFGRSWYGTPRAPVEATLRAGRLAILDIDVQGALQVRRSMPESLLVFVLPPSDAELLRRLHDRGRDSEEAIQRRFAEAQREIATARDSGAYDGFVVNAELERAVAAVASMVEGRGVRRLSSCGDSCGQGCSTA